MLKISPLLAIKQIENKQKEIQSLIQERNVRIEELKKSISNWIDSLIQKDPKLSNIKNGNVERTSLTIRSYPTMNNKSLDYYLDIVYQDGETYDIISHRNLTLEDITSRGSRFIDDTQTTLTLSYKINFPGE